MKFLKKVKIISNLKLYHHQMMSKKQKDIDIDGDAEE